MIDVSSQNRVEDEQVVGLDQSEHRAPEEHQQTGEAAEVGGLRREVARRVEEHGHADPTDDQRHRGGEPVELEVEGQVESADPSHFLGHRDALGDIAELRCHPSGCQPRPVLHRPRRRVGPVGRRT